MGLFALHDYKMTASVTSGSNNSVTSPAPRKRRTFDIAFLTGQTEGTSEPPSSVPVTVTASKSSGSSSNSSKRLLLSREEWASENTNSSSNCSIDILTNGSSLSDSEERDSPLPIRGRGTRGFMKQDELRLPAKNPIELNQTGESHHKLSSQFSPQHQFPVNHSHGHRSPNSDLTLAGPPFGFLPHMAKFPLPGMQFGGGKSEQGSPPSPADMMLQYAQAQGNAIKGRRGCYPPEHYPPPGMHYPPFHPYPGINISLMVPQEFRGGSGNQGQSPGQGGAATSPGISPVTLLPPSLTSLTLPAQNVCAKCNIGFRMTSDLVYHMRSHHKREVDPLKKKREDKLKCPVCHETFRERHHLTRHMTAHQDRAEEAEEANKPIQIV